MKIVIIILHYTLHCKDIIQIKALSCWEKFQRIRGKKAANDASKSVWTMTLCLKGTPTKGKLGSSPDSLNLPVLDFCLYMGTCLYVYMYTHTHQKVEELMSFK